MPALWQVQEDFTNNYGFPMLDIHPHFKRIFLFTQEHVVMAIIEIEHVNTMFN